jgi:hypothetical protein
MIDLLSTVLHLFSKFEIHAGYISEQISSFLERSMQLKTQKNSKAKKEKVCVFEGDIL